ncbi:MAG: phosphatase PAP2 family protein [Sandaracinus sp.]|nr:phosphatase PAP2 family protein [Myxococcales bacterium]MCB9600338.1 phosphatase PAP2 family protein [Sandaracinus sp.]MCB9617193.1 phosphatase PAP2 family protein [Sandaracinus sp.]MCB9620206.1 phosphatase PAP2 family protein [Sandaracinus sp.]MCB9632790.1 phosphatase PAP2 family protein [Sandaracinus sp.]
MRWCLVALVLSVPSLVSAQRLQWQEDWRRADWIDATVIGLGFATTLTVALAVNDDTPRWDARGPVDAAMLATRTPSATRRRRLSLTSDMLMIASAAFGPVFLEPFVAWTDHRGFAGQLAVTTLRSYAVATAVLTTLKYGLRRRRPPCDPDVGPEPCRESDANRSFPSGHTTMAFTAAALSCTAHRHAPIYGESQVGGAVACGALTAVATTTALLRLFARRHHVSDVVVGALVGIASGWLLPLLASYGGFGGTRR